ncbi:hypothetical protein F5890DRAFT_906808 [Lentinula detonsa]|uniref:Uncharacterized protein n=1 Tax=Lentinula detonsa TaxID=2804962 RepID=A0AA38UVC6_9AGAR|nr:hypothetical protein F5890DRAFT_906808 [Lentinula detonsa]
MISSFPESIKRGRISSYYPTYVFHDNYRRNCSILCFTHKTNIGRNQLTSELVSIVSRWRVRNRIDIGFLLNFRPRRCRKTRECQIFVRLMPQSAMNPVLESPKSLTPTRRARSATHEFHTTLTKSIVSQTTEGRIIVNRVQEADSMRRLFRYQATTKVWNRHDFLLIYLLVAVTVCRVWLAMI